MIIFGIEVDVPFRAAVHIFSIVGSQVVLRSTSNASPFFGSSLFSGKMRGTTYRFQCCCKPEY